MKYIKKFNEDIARMDIMGLKCDNPSCGYSKLKIQVDIKNEEDSNI